MTEASPIRLRFRVRYERDPNGRPALDLQTYFPGQGVTALFGASGSGKTTCLRCLAGLLRAPGGYCEVGGRIWQDDRTFIPTHRRALGYVFQEASLLPHLSAMGNLRYALRRQRSGRPAGALDELIELMGIEPLLSRRPHQLSGGERQRVAIVRSLATAPDILLMDEPLAALDQARKNEILPYLERLRDKLPIPILYVSHSIDEVARLADHIVVLDRGAPVEQGALSEVISGLGFARLARDEPSVVVDARVEYYDPVWQLLRVRFADGLLQLCHPAMAVGTRVRVRILARDVSLALQAYRQTSIQNRLQARVMEIVADGDSGMSLVRLSLGNQVLLARVTALSVHQLALAEGAGVWAHIKSVALVS